MLCIKKIDIYLLLMCINSITTMSDREINNLIKFYKMTSVFYKKHCDLVLETEKDVDLMLELNGKLMGIDEVTNHIIMLLEKNLINKKK